MDDSAQSKSPQDVRSHRLQHGVLCGFILLFSGLGIARYLTVHNQTFDLAFYTRMAWGMVRHDRWDPLLNAHLFGLHLSPCLIPLGWLGEVFGTVPVLIGAQALCFGMAAIPIMQIAERHVGPRGRWLGLAAWLLYPNLTHVAAYEFHPGSLAVLPLAWLAWAIDRGHTRILVASVVGTLLCREDLGLVAGCGALLFAWKHPKLRREASIAATVSFAYVAYFFFVLHPQYAPETGSLQLHFGEFGNSVGEVLWYFITHPIATVQHFATTERLLYVPKVLAPLACLTLRKPQWAIPALPIIAINIISAWPSTTDLSVHYLTPALPFLVAGAFAGMAAFPMSMRPKLSAGLLVALSASYIIAGGSPLSMDFDASKFRSDDNTEAAYALMAQVPDDASVQAPDALLAHLAERRVVRRGPPPDTNADFVILDVSHRHRFRQNEDLLRATEEPLSRTWLARDDHQLIAAQGDYLLLEKDGDPRGGYVTRYFVEEPRPTETVTPLTACLAFVHASRNEDDELILELEASGPCENDIALRIGQGRRPSRVDLLWDGRLSPAHLRAGDRLRSVHPMSAAEWRNAEARELRIGALRSSGARPEHRDPMSIRIRWD